MKEIFAGLAITCSLVSSVIYIRAILKRETKPHLFSWIVWGLLMLISAAAQHSDHAGAGAIATAASGACCIIIAILSIKYGERNPTRSDWISFATALSAIPLWWATSDPLLSVILITFIDAFGFYPTFRKSYSKPYIEDLTAWLLSTLTALLLVLSIENYTVITSLYQASILLTCSTFITMLIWRRRVLKR